MTVKPIYTPAERAKRARLVARGMKQAFADCVDPKIDREIDRIDEKALERGREAAAEEERTRKEAARELAAAKAARKTLAQQKRAAAIRAVDAAKVQRHANRKASKVKSSSWW